MKLGERFIPPVRWVFWAASGFSPHTQLLFIVGKDATDFRPWDYLDQIDAKDTL